MKIAFKLFANLTDYLPAERKGNRLEIEIDPETSVQNLIDRYRIPPESAHLVLINGVFVPPAARAGRRLSEGDELAIWPPIAGG